MIKKLFSRPVPALLMGAIIISFSSVLVNISDVHSSVSAFYRMFFGSLFLICICFVKKEFKIRKLKKNLLAIACGLVFALDLLAWHASIGYVGPGLATILGNFQVFVLTIVGFMIFKEKITITFVLSLPLAFLGLFLILGIDIDHLSRSYGIGVFLGLLTAIFYSMYLLILRKLQSDKNDFSLVYYLMLVTVSCLFFLVCWIYASNRSFQIPDATTFSALLCLGFFIQCVAWIMISNALPKVKASHAGLILLLQPTLSFIWDVIFFNRQTGTAGWIGVIIVVTALYLGMTAKEKPS